MASISGALSDLWLVCSSIIADFFNRNIDIIDEHTNHKSDKATLIEAILKDFFDYNRETINQYIKFKNDKTT